MAQYPYQDLVTRQLSWAAVGVVGAALVSLLKSQALTAAAYPLALVVLLGVSVVSGHGSQSWLRPADVACVVAIPALARFSARQKAPPSPASALGAGAVMSFIGLALLGSAGPAAALVWISVALSALSVVRWTAAQRVAWGGTLLLAAGILVARLQPYQVARLKYWLFPGEDPRGAGWRLLELRRLLGEGGWWGAEGSWPKGHGVFALEAPYAFVGHQAGWLALAGVVLLNLVVAGVATWIGFRASRVESRAIGRGVAAFWSVHLLLAAGGNLGLLPEIANTPPLIGYGGSAVVAALLSLGLLIHVLRRREETSAAETPARAHG